MEIHPEDSFILTLSIDVGIAFFRVFALTGALSLLLQGKALDDRDKHYH